MLALLLLIVVGSTVWVGFDASTRDFSGCRVADTTAAWVGGCLLLWIVFFPAYLVQRGRAPLKHPSS